MDVQPGGEPPDSGGGSTLDASSAEPNVGASEGALRLIGNPEYDPFPVAPAIYASGSDAMSVEIDLGKTALGQRAGVSVRVKTVRPALIAPNGANLGIDLLLDAPSLVTDASGRATARITTTLSTRVEGRPTVGKFVPFEVVAEVEVGGSWQELGKATGNAQSTIDQAKGQTRITHLNGQTSFCPGDTVEITTTASRRASLGGGPASNRYVELRRGLSNGSLIPVTPRAGYESWRTDGAGVIEFTYTTVAADASKIIMTWVDGQPLDSLAFFYFAADCPP